MAPSIAAPALLKTPTRNLRLGFIALTDAAPIVVAGELGLFVKHGLRVELSREIGWATVREKIIYGELDATHAPAPMLWSAQLGIGCPPCEVLSAFVLNLNGSAFTLSTALWEAGVRDGATLRAHIRERRSRQPLTFGVVFQFSSHHLLIREWLRASNIDPERDVRIVVVPPAQMFRNLAAGTIDGYCVGDPWNSLAVREGIGWLAAWGSAQQPGMMEKVVMVTRRFATTRAAEHAALILALHEAAAWCEDPKNRERLADILSDARVLNVPTRVITPALSGRIDCGHGRIENVPDFHVFHRGDANAPSPAKGAIMQEALVAAGLLSPVVATPDLPRLLLREDLYRAALSHQTHEILPTPELPGLVSK